MTTSVKPEELLAKLRAVATENLELRLNSWYDLHSAVIQQYQRDLSGALKQVQQAVAEQAPLALVWEKFLKYSQAQGRWAGKLEYISADLSARNFYRDWLHTVNEALKTVTPEIEAGQVAGFRRLFRRRKERFFRVHDYCRTFLLQPFAAFCREEWNEYLAHAFADLHGIYRTDREVTQHILLLPTANEAWIRNQAGDLHTFLQHIDLYAGQIENMSVTQQEHRAAALQRFEDWWMQRAAEFHRQWEHALSFVLREQEYDRRKIRAKSQQLTTNFNRERQAWLNHYTGVVESWQHESALYNLQLTVGQQYLELNRSFRKKIDDEVNPVMLKTAAIIQQSITKLSSEGKEKQQTLRRAIARENRELLAQLRDELLPNMMDTLLRAKLSTLLRDFQEGVKKAIEQLPPKTRIFKHFDKENKPPHSTLDEVAIKELIQTELFARFDNQLTGYRKKLSRNTERMLLGISEIDEIVEFNLDAALGLLEKEDGAAEARKMLIEGLERAHGKVNHFVERFSQLSDESEQALFEMSRKFCGDLQDLRDTEKLLALQVQVMQAKARQRILQLRRNAQRLILGVGGEIWKRLKDFAAQLAIRWTGWMRALGLMETPATAGESLAHFLGETREKIEKLPYVYQRLFKLEALADERFFGGRDGELADIKNAFSAWKSGKEVTALVVGEKGSGQTTLLNFAAPIFENVTCYRVMFSETIQTEEEFIRHLKRDLPELTGNTWEDLEKVVKEREEPLVLVVENLQNLFLKTIDGFGLLQRFLLLIVQSSREVFWIVSCNRYSWDYLDRVLKLSRFFSRIIPLEGMEQHEIEDILIKRHRVTGYRLVFDIPSDIASQRRFRKKMREGEEQAFLRGMFFEQLKEISAGNISVAMLYWLRAIIRIDEEQLILSPVIDFDYSFIFKLGTDELFTLGALVQHDMLEVWEHAAVFHQSEEKSLAVLGSLYRHGILLKEEVGYRIHPFLYRPVVRALTIRNILH